MTDYLTTDSELEAVADAIRAKGATSALLVYPNGFVSAINAIPTGITPTGTKSIPISAAGTTTEDVTNYASAEITVPSGSAATPATTITANPTISVGPTGLITASVSGSQSVTPSVSAGYVSSGTAGTVSVSGSNTSQLTTQAAQTITPTTSDQTIASGKYLTGTQTIKGDANLVAANIADGVTIFGVTGTHQGGGGGGATEYVVQPSQHPVMGFWGYDLSSVGLSASDFARDAHTKIWIEATSNISVTVWLDAYQDDDFTVTIPAGTIFECVSSDDLTYMLTSRFAFSCGANAPYGFFNASADKSEDFVQVDTGGDDPSLGCFVQTTGYKRQNGCPFLGWGELAELATLHILKY